MKYSEKLIKRMQMYWKGRFGSDISEEAANEYLDSLGGLYLCLSEARDERLLRENNTATENNSAL